jgi:hypothetical protein
MTYEQFKDYSNKLIIKSNHWTVINFRQRLEVVIMDLVNKDEFETITIFSYDVDTEMRYTLKKDYFSSDINDFDKMYWQLKSFVEGYQRGLRVGRETCK